jgi:pyruvate-formate lyase-activating enzyme
LEKTKNGGTHHTRILKENRMSRRAQKNMKGREKIKKKGKTVWVRVCAPQNTYTSERNIEHKHKIIKDSSVRANLTHGLAGLTRQPPAEKNIENDGI